VHFIFPTPSETNFKNEEYLELLQEKAANPYLRIGFPEKNTYIGIDKIRELKREAGFKTYEGKRKVYIFSDADQLRPEAANAMLKLLEEPPANLLLILITSNMNKILPTIKSRCQLIRFPRLSEEQIREIIKNFRPEINENQLRLIIHLADYNLKQIFEFLDVDVEGIRELALEYLRKLSLIHRSQELMAIIENMNGQRGRREARQLLWFLLLWFRDILHYKNGIIESNRLTNFDMVDKLGAFISYAPNVDVQKIVWDIENAIQDLNDIRNFNPVLILTTLAFKLNRKIRA
jgi:DNA polymerase-3 subunit delta'